MSVAVWVAEDLSHVRLLCADGVHSWSAARDDEDALKEPVRSRAEGAAAFIREHTAKGGEKVGAVVLGVDDARCLWVSAPSASPEVLIAAVRKRAAEWGEEQLGATIQPLHSAESPSSTIARLLQKEKQAAATVAQVSVLEVFDGPLRLLLDVLDRAGVRPARVLTHWHALCACWGETTNTEEPNDDSVRAIVSMHPDQRRLVWAWSRSGRLIAGGGAMLGAIENEPSESEYQAAVGRLSLDWLTWGAQLGESPASIQFVGEGSSDIARALGSRFKDASVLPLVTGDALPELLKGLADGNGTAGADGDIDPRRHLVAATERSGVMQRRLLRVASLGVLLLGAATFGLAYRFQSVSGAMRTETARLRNESMQTLRTVAPELARPGADPLRTMDSALAAIREENPALEPPPPAKQIYQEVARLLTAVAETEEADIGVLNIDERSPTAQIDTEGFGPGELLKERLDKDTTGLRWSWSSVGAAPNVRWRLTGLWRLPE